MGAGASAKSKKKKLPEGSGSELHDAAGSDEPIPTQEETLGSTEALVLDSADQVIATPNDAPEPGLSSMVVEVDENNLVPCYTSGNSELDAPPPAVDRSETGKRRDALFMDKSKTQTNNTLLSLSVAGVAATQRKRMDHGEAHAEGAGMHTAVTVLAASTQSSTQYPRLDKRGQHNHHARSWLRPHNLHEVLQPELARVSKSRDGALNITKLTYEEDVHIWAISTTGGSIVMAAATSAVNSTGQHVSVLAASKMVFRSTVRGTVEEWCVSSKKPKLTARQQGFIEGDRTLSLRDGMWLNATVKTLKPDGDCIIVWDETGEKATKHTDALRRPQPALQVQPQLPNELDESYSSSGNEVGGTPRDPPRVDDSFFKEHCIGEDPSGIPQDTFSDHFAREDHSALQADSFNETGAQEHPAATRDTAGAIADEGSTEGTSGAIVGGGAIEESAAQETSAAIAGEGAIQEICGAMAAIEQAITDEASLPCIDLPPPVLDATLSLPVSRAQTALPANLQVPSLKAIATPTYAIHNENGFDVGDVVECLSHDNWHKASIRKDHGDGSYTVRWETCRGTSILQPDKIRRIELPEDMIPHLINIVGAEKAEKECMGNFLITDIKPLRCHGGRPIYMNETSSYMYYWKPRHRWLIAYDSYEDDCGALESASDGATPMKVSGWLVWHHGSMSPSFPITITCVAEAHAMSDRYKKETQVLAYGREGHIDDINGSDKDSPFFVIFDDGRFPREAWCAPDKLTLIGELEWTPVGNSFRVGADSCLRSFFVGEADVYSAEPACYASWKVTAERGSARTLGLSLGKGPSDKTRFALVVEADNVMRITSSLDACDDDDRYTAMPGDHLSVEHQAGEIHFLRNGEEFEFREFHVEPDEHTYAYASIRGVGGEMCDLVSKHHSERVAADVVEDLQAKGFSVRQLLQFCIAKEIGKDKPTTNVVRDIIIPETADRSTCYMDSQFMQALGGPHRAHRFVSHAWTSPFLNTVLNIVLDATECTVSSLKMKLNDQDLTELAVEKTGVAKHKLTGKRDYGNGLVDFTSNFPRRALELLDKSVLDITYWMCIFGVNQHEAICGNCWVCNPKTPNEYLSPVCDCGRIKQYPCKCGAKKHKWGDLECAFDKWALVMGHCHALVISLDCKLDVLHRLWATAEIGESRHNDPITTIHFKTSAITDKTIMKLRRRCRNSSLLPVVAPLHDAEVSNPEDRELLMAAIREESIMPEVKEGAFDIFVKCMVELSFGICHCLDEIAETEEEEHSRLSSKRGGSKQRHSMHRSESKGGHEEAGDENTCSRSGSKKHIELGTAKDGAREALESLERLEMRCGWAIHISTLAELGFGEHLHQLTGLKDLTLNFEELQLTQTREVSDHFWSEMQSLKSLTRFELDLSKSTERKTTRGKFSGLLDGHVLGHGIGRLMTLQHLVLLLEDVEIKDMQKLMDGISKLRFLTKLEISLKGTLGKADELAHLSGLSAMTRLVHLDLNLAGSRITNTESLVGAVVQLPELEEISLNLRKTRASLQDVSALGAKECKLHLILPDGIEINSTARLREVMQEPVGDYGKRFVGMLPYWEKKDFLMQFKGNMEVGWGRGWAVAKTGILPGQNARWKVHMSEETGEQMQVVGVVSDKKLKWSADPNDLEAADNHWIVMQAPKDINHYVMYGMKKVAYIFNPGEVVEFELNRTTTHTLSIEGERGQQTMKIPVEDVIYPAVCFQNGHQHAEISEYSEENRMDLVQGTIMEAIESEDIKQLEDMIAECECCGFEASALAEARELACYMERSLAALSLLHEAKESGDMLSMRSAVIEGQRTIAIYEAFSPPTEEESLEDDDEKECTVQGQGSRIRKAMVKEIEEAQTILAGLEEKVDSLNELAEAIASRDIPTLHKAIEKGATPTTYSLCAESTESLQAARKAVKEWEEKMEMPTRCFFIGHPIKALGTKRNDGWVCHGFQGGCKSGITGRFQTGHMPRFRCLECHYDLCEKCLEGWRVQKQREEQRLAAPPADDEEDEEED